VHVKNIKPFQGSNSRNFSSNFHKQGGDANNFDHLEDKDEKVERSDMKDRRDKRLPKEQYKKDDEDKTDQGSSDSDLKDEECRIIFSSKADSEKQYFLPPSISVPDGKTETETEIEIKEEGEEALPDKEEPIRREEGLDDIWINSKLRKSLQKQIKVLEQQQADGQSQAKNLINIQVVRFNLISQIHPFIVECQK
jgi:hypothetical protein